MSELLNDEIVQSGKCPHCDSKLGLPEYNNNGEYVYCCRSCGKYSFEMHEED